MLYSTYDIAQIILGRKIVLVVGVTGKRLSWLSFDFMLLVLSPSLSDDTFIKQF